MTDEYNLLPLDDAILRAGHAADQAAARHRFDDYRARLADHTLRRHEADLALLGEFLHNLGIEVGDLPRDPAAWRGLTWGLVEAFVRWLLQRGYAVSSVNIRLSTVKTYARLAAQAGMLSPEAFALIRTVSGFRPREIPRIDQRRPRSRVGAKKASPVMLSAAQAAALKQQPNTPQGRRDTVLVCLLLDHGLRVGELAGLAVEDFDLSAGVFHFHRPKVNKTQTHRLSADALRALQAYAAQGDLPPTGLLLRRSYKDDSLGSAGMSDRAITQRVRTLGEQIGVAGLSAHDCRHYWATAAARAGVDPFRLQQAGGWASLNMPARYIAENEIANDGINLD